MAEAAIGRTRLRSGVLIEVKALGTEQQLDELSLYVRSLLACAADICADLAARRAQYEQVSRQLFMRPMNPRHRQRCKAVAAEGRECLGRLSEHSDPLNGRCIWCNDWVPPP